MKRLLIICFSVFCSVAALGQFERSTWLDTLSTTKVDTMKLFALWQLSDNYLSDKPDSGRLLAERGYALAREVHNSVYEATFLFTLGKMYKQLGLYPKAIELYLQSERINEKANNEPGIANARLYIGEVYWYQSNYNLALRFYFQAKKIYESNLRYYGLASTLLHIGQCYISMGYLDSALFYLNQIASVSGNHEAINIFLAGKIQVAFGDIYAQKDSFSKAVSYYRNSLLQLQSNNEKRTISQVMLRMAELLQKQGDDDSCITYARQSLDLAKAGGFVLEILTASDFFARYFNRHHNLDSAYVYLTTSSETKDSLFGSQKEMAIQSQILYDQFNRQEELDAQKSRIQSQVKIIVLLVAAFAFLVIAFILWRNNKQKHKANLLLQKQKQEIQKTLSELKAVQQQLIHTEKMASLGEVTAGIAHEIQNPLNFITNFSDVGNDLLQELKEELKTGDAVQALELTPMIEQSFQKISEHGQRADAIVKNMMQHAHKNTGVREPADVNAIVGDCLRLSYQGARTKDASFKANLKTQFDTSLGKINMVPQDMGRVLVNLFNNAFYSVQQKKKQEQNGYEPSVQVTTRKAGGHCEIRIRDNGLGIQEKVLDKIYQPFFTTKPAGEGTGLGLSMSYEIVTKTHGGQIKVNTTQGEYAEFIVELPLQ